MPRRRLTGEGWVTSGEKRAFDIALVAAALPVLIPVGATALGLRRLLDGPNSIFSHERVGQYGRRFTTRKVRTLRRLPGEEGKSDPIRQATPLGKILRPLAIDEIPQALNILAGDMSLTGPRAAMDEMFDYMQAALPRPVYEEWEHAYLSSRPGGISSYGIFIRGNVPASERVAAVRADMDIYDFNNASLARDLSLIRHAGRAGLNILLNGRPESA